MSLTRRHLAALLGFAPLAVGQTSPEPAKAPPSADNNPATLLSKAEGEVRDTSARLAQMQVPQNLEPAFAFRP